MKIHLVTTNQKKLLTARLALSQYDVDLDMLPLQYEAPELQSYSVEDIASFTARYIAEKEKVNVIVTDVGYFIHALREFPGPYVKQMNHYFSSSDLLRLMEGVEDRSFLMKECLAFCRPGSDPVVFTAKNEGTIAYEASGEGNALDTVMIREGLDKVQSLYPQEFMIQYYAEHLNHYDQFGRYYRQHLAALKQ